jgi:hypothetical protein
LSIAFENIFKKFVIFLKELQCALFAGNIKDGDGQLNPLKRWLLKSHNHQDKKKCCTALGFTAFSSL